MEYPRGARFTPPTFSVGWCNGATARRRPISLTRDAHVTDDTARHLRYTSRAKREADGLAVAPLHHDATGVRGWRPRASGGRPAALHVTDDTARHLRYTSRAKREADVSLSHRCTMEHPVAPWSTTMRRVLPPRDKRVKASPHRHKWM